jgi:hypothetical protein
MYGPIDGANPHLRQRRLKIRTMDSVHDIEIYLVELHRHRTVPQLTPGFWCPRYIIVQLRTWGASEHRGKHSRTWLEMGIGASRHVLFSSGSLILTKLLMTLYDVIAIVSSNDTRKDEFMNLHCNNVLYNISWYFPRLSYRSRAGIFNIWRGPIFRAGMFIFTWFWPMTEKLVNTDHEYNPSNRSGARVYRWHIKNHFFIFRGLQTHKSVSVDVDFFSSSRYSLIYIVKPFSKPGYLVGSWW